MQICYMQHVIVETCLVEILVGDIGGCTVWASNNLWMNKRHSNSTLQLTGKSSVSQLLANSALE